MQFRPGDTLIDVGEEDNWLGLRSKVISDEYYFAPNETRIVKVYMLDTHFNDGREIKESYKDPSQGCEILSSDLALICECCKKQHCLTTRKEKQK